MQAVGPGLLRRRRKVDTANFKDWVSEVIAWRLYASLFWLLVVVAVLQVVFLIASGPSLADIVPATIFLATMVVHHCSLRAILTGKLVRLDRVDF